jgi:SAM-dependent methyltransferase
MRHYTDLMFAQDVIDFGCGKGRMAELFGKKRYTGVDICAAAIDIAKQRMHGHRFEVIDNEAPIEGGYALFAHDVMLHIPDDDLYKTVGRFRQRRIIISECLGMDLRENHKVFSREIEGYERPFRAAGYRLVRVQFKPWRSGRDIAFLEFHQEH